MSRPMSDPFTAGPGSSIAYADDLNIANPSRIGSPGMASQVGSQAQSAPALSGSRGASSGQWTRTKTPWYLRTATILVLVAVLLIALALGLGLGLGLNRGGNISAASAAGQVGGTSVATVQSTIEVEETASNTGFTNVPSIVSNTGPASSPAIQVVTVGGTTVVVGGGNGAAQPTAVITVSETVDPITSTRFATRTIVAGVQTITSVVGGGAGGTVTITRTLFETQFATASPRARARRMVDQD